ncbi:hypothetical protein SLEP1_g31998 [Rubroshorea leprosula]|uniref:Polygalacturonase n=1 Tax=Rubroshorea leprosula TaxID=152421 RepID=A0AAV5KBX9_9ROSI|nr:hypothetical protein SLEP1_g31998 [Rubroshorea leprosula]
MLRVYSTCHVAKAYLHSYMSSHPIGFLCLVAFLMPWELDFGRVGHPGRTVDFGRVGHPGRTVLMELGYSITFNWANNIVISGLRSINSQLSHIVNNNCNNVMVKNVKLFAPDQSPNTNGIHGQHSTRVTITGSGLHTGDDCISIGPGTKNIIGSLGRVLNEAGVQNITLRDAVFMGSDKGVRIKTWVRQSNGFAVKISGVTYKNIRGKSATAGL